MYYIVYDNFLPPAEYGHLKSYVGENGGFPWNLSGRINALDHENSSSYFATNVFHSHNEPNVQWTPGIETEPFFHITSRLTIEAFQRIKCNLYFPSTTGKVEHHAKHKDGLFKHQGALFYLTTCDAPTTMEDGTEIESIENRLLLFDPATWHSSSSPTNSRHRITINFNYFGAGVSDGWRGSMVNPVPTLMKNSELLEQAHYLDTSNRNIFVDNAMAKKKGIV